MAEHSYTESKADLIVNKMTKAVYNDLKTNNQLVDDELYFITDHIPGEDPSIAGKRIWTFGDSIAWGKGYRNTANTDGGWSRILNDEYGAVATNYAKDGAILTTKSNSTYGNIITEINAHKNDAVKPDIVIFEGGINDCWKGANATLGTLTTGFSATLDTTTVIGALESICKTLLIDYAPAKILFLFPHNGPNVDASAVAGGKWEADYKPAMKSALIKWGIPYLDLASTTPNVGVNGISTTLKTLYLSDNTHLNELGYKTLYMPYIIGGLHSFDTLDRNAQSSSAADDICNIEEEQWTVTLTGDVGTYTASNTRAYVGKNKTYYNTIELGEDLVLNSITVTMGGTNITTTCVSNDVIEIETVTGDVVVTVNTNSSKHAVTRNLAAHLTSTNTADEVGAGQYMTTIKPNTGYRVDSITVTMDGTDVTTSVLTGNSINIPSVTGAIVITATELVGACEYITVSNTASVIDSGVEFTSDLKIEAKYQYGGSGSSSDKGVCGQWIDNNRSVFLAANMQRFGGKYCEVTVDTNVHTASTALGEFYYDGVKQTNIKTASGGTFTASTNHLFIAGMKADQYWGGKIWYVKVWKNGTLIRHYVPASETTLVDIVNS